MKTEGTYKSPAKVNLLLHVLGLRPDGYHTLQSLMSKISLFDTLKIKISRENGRQNGDGGQIKIDCPNDKSLKGKDNLIYKAASTLLKEMGTEALIHVELDKKIPVGGGLGGGSSNAATVLKALNGLLEFNISSDKLAEIGAKIGADVPFFIYEGSALVGGIGEIVEPIKNFPKLEMIVLYPGHGISTAAVYKMIKGGLTKRIHDGKKCTAFSGSEVVLRSIHNDLERFALQIDPGLAELKERLLESGALKALVSGSGSSVFGIFKDKQAADQAFEYLKGKNFASTTEGFKVFRVNTID